MAVNGIEIKVGQKWRTRGGAVVEISEHDRHDDDYPWGDRSASWWTDLGGVYKNGRADLDDLIELIEDASAPEPPDHTTLRDEFAKAVLTGLLANPGGPIQRNDRTGWGYVNCTPSGLVQEVWDLADAMLAARGGDK